MKKKIGKKTTTMMTKKKTKKIGEIGSRPLEKKKEHIISIRPERRRLDAGSAEVSRMGKKKGKKGKSKRKDEDR